MRLIFHHVGQTGADEDFKTAVYKNTGIETVGNSIPINSSHRDDIPGNQI
jgi:hypothetical protein